MLNADLQSLFILFQIDEERNCPVELPCLDELIDSGSYGSFIPTDNGIFLFVGLLFRGIHGYQLGESVLFS